MVFHVLRGHCGQEEGETCWLQRWEQVSPAAGRIPVSPAGPLPRQLPEWSAAAHLLGCQPSQLVLGPGGGTFSCPPRGRRLQAGLGLTSQPVGSSPCSLPLGG